VLTGNRHSPLNQINGGNIASLAARWSFAVGNSRKLEVTPVVVDGVFYVTTVNSAYALDARTGREIWRFERRQSQGLVDDAAGGINRGVAILGDRVFLVTDNAHLLALHRLTGSLLWETVMADSHVNYGATSAPLVVHDLVISGTSGGDDGIRGFVAAYKASTCPPGAGMVQNRQTRSPQQASSFCDDEHPDRMGGIGEELVRIYMTRAAPPIQPAAIEQQTIRGVLASVRIQAQFDILDEDGMIIAISTARNAPSSVDPMHRFELTTGYRLASGHTGVVRSDTLVTSQSPQCISQVWEINEADIQLTDALYPVAQEAMRPGYYMPNRGSVRCSRHQCPHWRRCEQDFGGVVEP
jgi:hypothetical protein